MDKAELQERMTVFAVRIVKMVDSMPTTVAGHAIARQIIRSGTSPSANYRAACLAKSIVTTKTRMKVDTDSRRLQNNPIVHQW